MTKPPIEEAENTADINTDDSDADTDKADSAGVKLTAAQEKLVAQVRKAPKRRPNKRENADFNINAETLRLYLLSSNPHRTPLCFWGGSGIGKTELIRQVADECGYRVFEYPMATADTLSFEGVPFIGDNNETRQAEPQIVAEIREAVEAGEKPLLFLDEVNQAIPMVQHALFQLFLPNAEGQRRLGQHLLPAGVKLVAAGNPPSANHHLDEMAEPLNNRMEHHDFQVSLEGWELYETRRAAQLVADATADLASVKAKDPKDAKRTRAIQVSVARERQESVLPAVLAYLSDHKDKFNDPYYYLENNAKAESDTIADYAQTLRNPNPRSWSNLIDSLAESEAMRMADASERLDVSLVASLARGTMGWAIGQEFAAFYRDIAKLPPPAEVLAKPEENQLGASAQQRYYQVERLIPYFVEHANEDGVVDGLVTILHSMMEGENDYALDITNAARLANRTMEVLIENFDPKAHKQIPSKVIEVFQSLNKDDS